MIEARREIKSMIYSRYDTEKDCAEHMGWPKQRLNKIVNGKKEPSITEVAEIADAIGQTVSAVATIFLRMKSPNG